MHARDSCSFDCGFFPHLLESRIFNLGRSSSRSWSGDIKISTKVNLEQEELVRVVRLWPGQLSSLEKPNWLWFNSSDPEITGLLFIVIYFLSSFWVGRATQIRYSSFCLDYAEYEKHLILCHLIQKHSRIFSLHIIFSAVIFFTFSSVYYHPAVYSDGVPSQRSVCWLVFRFESALKT